MRGRDEGDDRCAHTIDHTQLVPRKILVEQFPWSGKLQHAGFTETLEFNRDKVGQGNGFRQMQLSLVGFKGILVELVYILKQPRGTGQSTTVLTFSICTAIKPPCLR